MFGLIVPISSPSRISMRESAAYDERASPPARSTMIPAPIAAAPRMNSRLFISEAHVAQSLNDLSQFVVLSLFLGVAQTLEGSHRGLGVCRSFESTIGEAELVIGFGYARVLLDNLFELCDRVGPSLGAHEELAE